MEFLTDFLNGTDIGAMIFAGGFIGGLIKGIGKGIGKIAGPALGFVPGVGGILSGIFNAIKKNPYEAAGLGAAGLSAFTGAKKQGQANRLIGESIARSREREEARRPFRQAAARQLLGRNVLKESRADLSHIFGPGGASTSNPFARANRARTASRSKISGRVRPRINVRKGD